jgi:uncharacterized protein (TIRG00374 family)
MANHSHFYSFLRAHWKLLLNIVTIAALALFIVAIHKQLAETISNFSKVNLWILLLVLPIEALNYHAQARLYQQLFAAAGNVIPYKNLLKISLELNFVNHIFPSGGVTGLSYFGLRMRGEGVRPAKSTIVQAIKLVLVFVTFEILLIFGMFVLAANGRASNMMILIGSVLSTLLIVGTAAFAYMVGSKQRIESFLTILTSWLNRLIQFIRRGNPETINIERARQAFGEFHEDYKAIRSQRRELRGPFFWALIANATEVAVVLIVFVAFAQYINVGAVILAYAVANFAGLVSVLPGGVGIYEALMTAVMATAGVPAGVSLPAIVMYRVVNTLIQVPPGYYLYHRALISGKTEPVHYNASE